MSSRRRMFCVLAAAAALAGQAALAAPGDRTTHLVSFPDAGTPSPTVRFAGAAADGSRVWFTTNKANPALGDLDARSDIYERGPGGVLRLISFPQANAASTDSASFGGASLDGTKVWFDTSQLPDGSSAVFFDAYERRADGTTRLISMGNGTNNGLMYGANGDASRVWFWTNANDPALGDTDNQADIYERGADGSLTLVTPGTAARVDPPASGAAAVAKDGSRLWYETASDNPALGDTDGVIDVYEYSPTGGTRLVSTGGSAPGADALLVGASGDGTHAYFTTVEGLAGGDGNGALDIYDRASGGGVSLLSLAGGAGIRPVFDGAAADGSRAWFTTFDPSPALGDTDIANDVYERSSAGTLRLITVENTTVPFSTFLAGAADGSRVLYLTREPAPALGDTDSRDDIYERSADGGLRLVNANANTAVDVTFAGATPDLTRVWYRTSEPNTALADTDPSTLDIFERAPDGTIRLMTTPDPAAAPNAWGPSADGTRFWYDTARAQLPAEDTDSSTDIYEVRWGAVTNLTPPAVTGAGQVGAPLTCAPGTWTGEQVTLTTEWTRDGTTIAGARGATYTPTAADAGHAIGCRVTAANAATSAVAATGTIAIAPAPAPSAVAPTGSPRITGASVAGTRLRCDATGITGAATVAYVWLRDGRRGPVTTSSYLLRTADLGHRLACEVVARNSAGSLTATSAPRVVPARCRVPAVRGKTLDRARELAGLAGCRVRALRGAGAGVGRGAVVRTTPRPGATLRNGATVVLTIRR